MFAELHRPYCIAGCLFGDKRFCVNSNMITKTVMKTLDSLKQADLRLLLGSPVMREDGGSGDRMTWICVCDLFSAPRVVMMKEWYPAVTSRHCGGETAQDRG